MRSFAIIEGAPLPVRVQWEASEGLALTLVIGKCVSFKSLDLRPILKLLAKRISTDSVMTRVLRKWNGIEEKGT